MTGEGGLGDHERLIAECLIAERFWEVRSVASNLWGDVPVILSRVWDSGDMSDEQRRSTLRWVWINTMAPVKIESNDRGLDQSEWVRMFHSTGYLSRIEPAGSADGSEVGLPYPLPAELLTQPTGELVAWRGASVARQRGMSWTYYRQCAEEFVRVAAEHQEAVLVCSVVPGRAVLAAFADGREQEVVVNPGMLPRELEVVERVPPASAG